MLRSRGLTANASTLSETAEFQIEVKRTVRAREEEEGDEGTQTPSFWSRRKRRNVFAKVGGRVAQQRSGRRINEGSQRKAEDAAKGARHGQTWDATGFLPPTLGAANCTATSGLTWHTEVARSSVDHHPCMLVSSVETTVSPALPVITTHRLSQIPLVWKPAESTTRVSPAS